MSVASCLSVINGLQRAKRQPGGWLARATPDTTWWSKKVSHYQ